MKYAVMIGQITDVKLKISGECNNKKVPSLSFAIKFGDRGGVTYSYDLYGEDQWQHSSQYYFCGEEVRRVHSDGDALSIISDIIGTEMLNEAKGLYVRCIMTHPHCGAQIRGIGHIMDDKFLISPHWEEEIKTYDIPNYYYCQVGKYNDPKEYDA